jgi:AraC-like DNA-binding protein/quercetin dioxygenase-like cupin family protein
MASMTASATSSVRRQRNLGDIRILEQVYPAGLVIERHSHPHTNLVFLLAGRFTETYPDKQTTGEARSVYFVPAGLTHVTRIEQETHCLVARLSEQTLAPIREDGRLPAQPGSVTGVVAQWLVQRMESEFQSADGLAELAMQGILLESLAEVARAAVEPGLSSAPRWLRTVRQVLDARFRESLNLADIARAAGVHRVHLAREFRRHFACTVGEYLRRRRVEEACAMIANSGASLAEIAVRCGFADQSHFSAIFRRHLGITPARYRESRAPRTNGSR